MQQQPNRRRRPVPPSDFSEFPSPASSSSAEQRRHERLLRQRSRRQLLAVCILCPLLILLSLGSCLLIFDVRPQAAEVAAVTVTPLPYSPDSPFSMQDLTPAQQAQLRSGAVLSLSDGPRGISIGDSLEKLIARYPSASVSEQPDDVQILYCADYAPNQNGVMTVLPPCGLLSMDYGRILVTLLAPTTPYPAGTFDTYRQYEHVYCRYLIQPDTMTISSITIGIGY